MTAPDLTHVRTWIFDLDNTLYSPHSDLFPQIHARMDQYIMRHFSVSPEEAAERRTFYFHTYGTSLRGLMIEEKIPPDDFLDFCHDIDLQAVAADPDLCRLIKGLPGQKIIFTNADARHARRILDRRGITQCFDGVFDIADGAYVCKPQREPYVGLLKKYSARGQECCMFDDMEANLKPAAEIGMTTVWLRHEAQWLRNKPGPAENYPHCHYSVDDLTPFLKSIMDKAS